ncbi:MAG: hypothetical protein HQL26_05900 [Candidatus Omnitrophica bacterium]|nr:hypothetical protein [Candidatus Omnitrophota bacterium]
MLKKFTSNHGQGLSEYIMLTLLVMAGIIIMGPYVVRSWNAQQKGWDDSVRDSYEDPLTKTHFTSSSDPCSACTYYFNCNKPPCCDKDNKQVLTRYCPSEKDGGPKDPNTCSETPTAEKKEYNLHCCTPENPGANPPCGAASDPACPEGGTRVNYTCGGGSNKMTGTECVYSENCMTPCTSGTWGLFLSDPKWDNCHTVADSKLQYRFRIRECTFSGEPCFNCLCPAEPDPKNLNNSVTNEHLGIEYQDAQTCLNP